MKHVLRSRQHRGAHRLQGEHTRQPPADCTRDADAACVRGRCMAALGNSAEAYVALMAALAAEPGHAGALLELGSLYRVSGLLPEAAAVLRGVAAAQPGDAPTQHALAVVLTDLGTQMKLAGRVAEGVAHYEEAVVACPSYAPAFYNIGVVHSEARDFANAKTFYERAIEASPSYAEAHCNLGVIHRDAGRLEAAVACYEAALAAAPSFAIVQQNLSIALTELGTRAKLAGERERSVALYERALALAPRYPDALYNLGVACSEAGQAERALHLYELAVHFQPACAEAWNNLGVLQRSAGNLERAVACYRTALQLRPSFPQAVNNVAVVLTAQGRVSEALALLQAALTAAPDYAEAHNNLGVLQRDVGAIKEAIASYERCLELAPESRNAGQNRLLALNYIMPGEDAAVCAAHTQWGEAFQRMHPPMQALVAEEVDADPARPLVVGYVSPDLFTHSVSYFAEAPLALHNSTRVRHIVYSCVPMADAKTARLRAAVAAAGGAWHEVGALPEAELAARVRADRCDVLVELTGHTAGNRLGVLAMRPAPVQVTWIGYPNSTGLGAVGYRLTDAAADPPDTAQTYAEELVRLPGCFLCYTPAADVPPVAPLPALEHGFVTFGSFNALAKVTPEVLRLWARILAAVPDARLLLKNKPFACESARAHFLAALAAEGVAPARVDVLPLTAGTAEHLALYAALDVSLDPFPYAGTTTTCESLFMGVPVVTLAGACHAHNVGVSLLEAVGLQRGWVAASHDEYVALAVAAAHDA
ncbi:hypothetical protein WJX81_006345 [Elliptochloris bilobata]|uniref:protein O-GlcNAc transferase n=1 Tax=Elliptochloris bilobata TaxID=381761 RepID=A0AAW1QNH1_9CHLO